jgi:hypothetical protein
MSCPDGNGQEPWRILFGAQDLGRGLTMIGDREVEHG